jgi:hypothetical protein
MQEEIIKFKKILEYFVSHLEWIENKRNTFVGYDKYIKSLVDDGSFKMTGQGYDGAGIQNQIKDWQSYSCGKICINVQGNYGSYKSVKCYLNWEHTGINVLARWKDNQITGLYQDEFIYWEKPTRRVNSNKEFSLEKLKLFEGNEISDELIDFYATFKQRFETFQKNEKLEKLMSSIYRNRDLLYYKKQIILQGPPGTGKTREAKLIASFLTSKKESKFKSNSIDNAFILNNLKPGLRITGNSNNSYEIEDLEGNIIRVKNNNGKQYSYNVDSVLKRISDNLLDINDGGKVIMNAIGKYILNKFKDQDNIESEVKLIQFHPSYTYEDFVRGITAKPNDNGEGVIYNAENKILGELSKKALNNYLLSQEDNLIAVKDKWIEESFNDFKIEIESLIGENDLVLSGNINIYKIENDCFRYGKDWQFPSRINFSEFKSLIKAVLNSKLDLNGNVIPKEISVHAHFRFTYYLALLRLFFQKYEFTIIGKKESIRNFVLIIDEINRANLSSVLGELIYALEYRGEPVESMYKVDDNNKLILPPNLYIIGTMNTADRSVGHIDYAIRRRFAFVDVLPKDLSDDEDIVFDSKLFSSVKALFTTDDYKTHSLNLSKEFEPKDVALGHSYFIQQYEKDEKGKEDKTKPIDFQMRLDYEIKPILLEYVKDGILIGKDIIEKIEQLEISI